MSPAGQTLLHHSPLRYKKKNSHAAANGQYTRRGHGELIRRSSLESNTVPVDAALPAHWGLFGDDTLCKLMFYQFA